jgi:hypothetical protein
MTATTATATIMSKILACLTPCPWRYSRHAPIRPRGDLSRRRSGQPGERPGHQWLVASLGVVVFLLMTALVPLMLYLMIAVTLLALFVGMMCGMIVLAPLRWLLG